MKKKTLLILITQLTSIIYAIDPTAFETNKTEQIQTRIINDQSLQSFFRAAKAGDFIVTKSGQLLTLINIHSFTAKTVILEEISVPVKNIKEGLSWAKWVKNKAPGHSSWSMIEIDLTNGQIVESYSFSKCAHIQISQNESLIATLLQLPLKEVQKEKRRRIGPTPLDGESDFRKIWQPALFFEGKEASHPEFTVLETTWPSDGSELSGRNITLYFDREMKLPFPYWVDLETSHINGHFHVIDSGKNIHSPQRTIPRRSPEFIKPPKQLSSGLLLFLKSPQYFQEFTLFAIDGTDEKKTVLPINCSLVQRNGEMVTIQINEEDLTTLIPNHRYQWMISPLGFDESFSEISKTFTHYSGCKSSEGGGGGP